MPLGLYPQETRQALQGSPDDPFDSGPHQPTFFEGAGTAAVKGVASGLAKTAELSSDAQTNLAAQQAKISGTDPNVELVAQQGAEGGYYPQEAMTDSLTKSQEIDPDTWAQQQRDGTASVVNLFKPDPHVTGTAGETLNGLTSGLTRIVAGGNPITGALNVGSTEGYSTAKDLKAAGVDEKTADLLGAGSGLFAGAGALIPGGFGNTLAQRVITGSAAQFDLGIVNRAMMHSALEDAGYDKMAQQYKALDGAAMMSDAVLGAAFGGVHHVFAPSAVDSALTVAESAHIEDAAPGAPVTPDARDQHVQQMVDGTTDLMNDRPVTDMRMPDTVPNPAQDAIRDTNEAAHTEAATEAITDAVGSGAETIRYYHGGLPGDVTSPLWFSLSRDYAQGYANKTDGAKVFSLDVPVDHPEIATDIEGRDVYGTLLPTNRTFSAELSARRKLVEPERRGDAADVARMQELRQKGLKNLTPDETAEYAGLLDRDRLAAKVGGRRMLGVLNDDAYAEMQARGEALPVQGFIDMDMLKSLNDTHGHEAGDNAIRTLGETLSSYFGEGNAFRRSSGGAGDEFIVQSKDIASHETAVSAARRYLDNHTIRALDKDGNIIAEKRGIGFSHGSGPDIASAERAQYAEKAERKRLGLRSDRSERNDGGAVSAKPAAERGEGGGSEAAGSEADRIADPVTQEAVDAATPLLDQYPDLKITDENGVELPAREAMQRALDDLRDAVGDDELHKVAAACFGRV